MPSIFKARSIPEDTGVVIYQRVIGPDAEDDTTDLVVAADVSTVTIRVFSESDDAQVGGDISATVATVFPATTRTFDGIVYNFRYETLAASVPAGDETYIFEFLIAPASGENYYLTPIHIPTIAMRGS